jgi:hypothetical protein
MTKKPIIFLILMLILILWGCIKETYNMKNFSDQIRYSPTFSIIAASGDISLQDLLKSVDTVKFNSDKFASIIYRKDAVIDLKLKDYYNLDSMVTFSKGYKVGDLNLDDFLASISIPLSSFSSSIAPPPVNGTFIFPPFGVINLGKKTFSAFPNFKYATFSSGTIVISVKNNLPVPLNSINITLFDSTGFIPVGSLTVPPIASGATQSSLPFSLAGKSLTNPTIASIVLTGSPGSSGPVLIDLNSTVAVTLTATNLKIQSGRVMLSSQLISSLSGVDVVPFDPGNNVEIEKLKVKTGVIGYTLKSSCNIGGSFDVTLPSTSRSDNTPVAATIAINGTTNVTSTIPINSTDVDLSTDVIQRYNRIPVNYTISINSRGVMITFNKNDSINLALNMYNPDLDYVKGYFGNMINPIEPDTLDTGLDEILNRITGQFRISSPSIKLRYSNSFGIPIKVTMAALGKRNTQTVNLGIGPSNISYPLTTTNRVIKDSLTVNSSLLADLVSMPPSKITFSGTAEMNPAGSPTGRNNYIFGDSRFLGNLEVVVPLELWMKNIQFADTVDNFLKQENSDKNSFKASDMDSLRIVITANNGFPMGLSVKMEVSDSLHPQVIKTIEATSLLLPAPVDANGRSNGKTQSTTTFEIKKDFLDVVNSSKKIIFVFTLNTTGNGSNVKFYSDDSLKFNAIVVAKPKISL